MLVDKWKRRSPSGVSNCLSGRVTKLLANFCQMQPDLNQIKSPNKADGSTVQLNK